MKYRFVFLTVFLFQQPILKAQTTHQPTFIKFVPVSFLNKFTLNVTPALRIHSGDTVSTETIDAMGRDKNGIKRQTGGNPLTGGLGVVIFAEVELAVPPCFAQNCITLPSSSPGENDSARIFAIASAPTLF